MKIGITGCVAQQEKDEILNTLPFVDMVIGPDNIDDLPWILEELSDDPKQKIVRTEFIDGPSDRLWHTSTQILNPGVATFISVMKGCDHFCSYCIVPYTRGREKSRPIREVIEDVKTLVSRGVKEVTFLGQNINTFGKRSGETLAQLFREAHEVQGLERIRFTTSHPGDLKDDLVECFRDLPKLCSSFHLPVQSGSDRVLRSMRRFYTRAQYLERVQALRAARPDIAFSTDMIVGFPGETEEDFELSLSLLKEVRYDNVYSFIFSPRPGTSAALRSDNTPEELKTQRLMALQNEARRISKEEHLKEVGKIREVLIEGPSRKDPNMQTGRTSQNVPVHIPLSLGLRAGDLVKLYISAATLTHLRGEPVWGHQRPLENKPTLQELVQTN